MRDKCPYGYSIVRDFVHRDVECGLKAEHLSTISDLEAEVKALRIENNDLRRSLDVEVEDETM